MEWNETDGQMVILLPHPSGHASSDWRQSASCYMRREMTNPQ